MTTRRKLVVGNWKMHGSHAANAELLQGILAARPFAAADVAVCAPFPYLSEVAVTLANSGVAWGAFSGLEAPRSSASANSSAVSKRWRASRAIAFITTWSSQIGTSGRRREGATGSRRKRAVCHGSISP